MFNNIGDKIKTVAQTLCWIGIIISIILGIFLIVDNDGSALTGVLVMVLGSISSWIGSFVTYGFGQLVENSDILVEQLYRKNSASKNVEKTLYTPQEIQKPVGKWTCPDCGNILPGDVIKCKCGYTKEDSASSMHIWRCRGCGKMISKKICPNCGTEH